MTTLQTDAEKAIREAYGQLAAAHLEGNLDEMMTLFSKDVVVATSDHYIIGRTILRFALAELLNSPWKASDSTELEGVKLLGSDVAVAWRPWALSSDDGQEVAGHLMHTWAKRGQRWVIIAEHACVTKGELPLAS